MIGTVFTPDNPQGVTFPSVKLAQQWLRDNGWTPLIGDNGRHVPYQWVNGSQRGSVVNGGKAAPRSATVPTAVPSEPPHQPVVAAKAVGGVPTQIFRTDGPLNGEKFRSIEEAEKWLADNGFLPRKQAGQFVKEQDAAPGNLFASLVIDDGSYKWQPNFGKVTA